MLRNDVAVAHEKLNSDLGQPLKPYANCVIEITCRSGTFKIGLTPQPRKA
jgi:hypothetical protein